MADFPKRSYSVEPRGKKFATIAREDGYWVCTWLSKNKARARWKGDEYVAGRRDITRIMLGRA